MSAKTVSAQNHARRAIAAKSENEQLKEIAAALDYIAQALKDLEDEVDKVVRKVR